MGKKKRRQEKRQAVQQKTEERHESFVHQDRLDSAKRRQMKVVRTYSYVFIAILLVAGLVYAAWPKPNEFTPFAQCLTEKGTIMFGADWCQHCQAQKRMFGSAFRDVDYRNCDFTTECQERGVTSYPTWIFEDGSRVTGEQQLDFLANKTGCMLPA